MSTSFPASVDQGLNSRSFTNKKITVKLDDSNYLIWKQQVYFMAKQHRLFSYLDGSVKAPPQRVKDTTTGLEVDNPEFTIYEQLDSALASWLLASVTSSVLPDLVGLETSAQIWQKLNRLYSDKSDSKILHYKNLLTNQCKGELSMRDYLANMKSICDHLALLGEPVAESSRISHILNGLTMEYESVIAIINASKPKFDLDTVTTMLIDSESRQKSFIANSVAQAHFLNVSNQHSDYTDYSQENQSAFVAQYNHGNQVSRNSYRPQFANVRGRGRGGRFYGGRSFSGQNKSSCQICHKVGHLADVCFFRFDSSASSRQPDQVHYIDFYNQPQVMTSETTDSGNWPVKYSEIPVHYSQNVPINYNQDMSSATRANSSANASSAVVSKNTSNHTPSEPTLAQAFVASPEIITDEAWYLDSGATQHITNSANTLQYASPPKEQ